MYSRSTLLKTIALLAACCSASSSALAGAGTQTLHVFGPATESRGRMERVYFVATTASEADAVAFQDHLIRSGFANVNLFLPDNVVVCEMPGGVRPASVDMPAGFDEMRESDSRIARASGVEGPVSWIRDCYAGVSTPSSSPTVTPTLTEANFSDVVVEITPERRAAAERELRAFGLGDAAPGDGGIAFRNMQQNSEFLAGKILAQFVYTESNGDFETESENWSDASLTDAVSGATVAMIAWQTRWAGMRMNFTFLHYRRAPTGYEPIAHNMNTDDLWVKDTVGRLYGPVAHLVDPIGAVHEFNNARRLQYGTDWVFTAFIANSENEPGNRFRDANYTAYAFLGGPYMIEPYPAGNDPNNIGIPLVFSQIVQHETGHVFWTLDEYPGAPGSCASRSGYLNYANLNITSNLRCVTEVPCIMNLAAREDLDRPFCFWSEGHLGVADANLNAIPDIWESEPVIQFAKEGPETVSVNSVTLNLTGVSVPVANMNKAQGPDRINYAIPLKDGVFSLGGTTNVPLVPTDGAWDEAEEDFVIELGLASVGKTSLSFSVRSQAGFRSQTFVKDIYFIGVNYSRARTSVQQNRVDVLWEVVGEDFGADFSVYRLSPGEASAGEKIAEHVAPSGSSTSGFIPYRVSDSGVQPGSDYTYYVEGVFSLDVDTNNDGTPDSLLTYHSYSRQLTTTAMIPLSPESILSQAAPNPFRDQTTVTLSVPQTFVETSVNSSSGTITIQKRVATDVDVAVYDVLGRRVTQLQRSSEFLELLTMRWNGTDSDGQRVPTGVYFIRAQAGDQLAVRKVLLFR